MTHQRSAAVVEKRGKLVQLRKSEHIVKDRVLELREVACVNELEEVREGGRGDAGLDAVHACVGYCCEQSTKHGATSRENCPVALE